MVPSRLDASIHHSKIADRLNMYLKTSNLVDLSKAPTPTFDLPATRDVVF